MIRSVVIKGFKAFKEVKFDLPGHVVLAGPNNSGKTTLLQAIATWSLALQVWLRRNDLIKHGGYYAKAPLTRQVFSAVPLRAFDLLWTGRKADDPIEITLQHGKGWTVTMELIPDTSEQIFVRPKHDASAQFLGVGGADISVVFVPPMTGLSTDEPVYQKPKIEQLLGSGKPGDVIRNLLVRAHENQAAWAKLTDSVKRLFGFELLPPDGRGADIVAEYRQAPGGPAFDLASAGSGFQQVLMLLTFLNTRAGSVLLLDEPDAHLHMILQDAIYGELRSVAASSGSQLVIATHSEVIIDSVDPRELCLMFGKPRMLATSEERTQLIESLGALSHTDIVLADQAPGVLYTDDYTDLDVLRAWAGVLKHAALELLTTKLLCKPRVIQHREGAKGIQAKDHYDALQLVKKDLPGLQLLDGDAHEAVQPTEIKGKGLQRLRWKRYEIESYLLHPDALARFVEKQVGAAAAPQHVADMKKYFQENFPPALVKEPLGDHEYLNTTKARTKLLPPLLEAAGLVNVHYNRFHEIAALMKPEEIHSEVKEKLDAIMKAFGQ